MGVYSRDTGLACTYVRTSSCSRFAADEVRVKFLVLQVGLHGLLIGLSNVLLVKVDETVQELVHLVAREDTRECNTFRIH